MPQRGRRIGSVLERGRRPIAGELQGLEKIDAAVAGLLVESLPPQVNRPALDDFNDFFGGQIRPQ